MTETEALDVKAMGLKEDDTSITPEGEQESQIEASVGENDVAALVDEAEKIKKMSSEEMDTNDNFLESPEEPVLETVAAPEDSKDETKEETEPMDVDKDTATEKEKVDDNSEVGISSELITDIDIKEEQSHIPEETSSNNITENEPVTTDDSDNVNNVNQTNETIPSTDSTIESTEEETNKEPKQESVEPTIDNISPDDQTKEIDPSNTETNTIDETIEETKESTSTQTVLQPEENVKNQTETSAQIEIPENNEAQTTTDNPSINDSFSEISETILNTSDPSNNVLKSVVDTTINDIITPTTAINSSPNTKMPITLRTGPGQGQVAANGSHGLPMLVKPPKTEFLLQTAREVLQLRDDPPPTNVIIGPGGQILTNRNGQIMDPSGINVVGQQQISILPEMVPGQVSAGQRMSLDDGEAVQSMEFADENATYILEPITNEVVYNDDPNIMWIQETVEVEQETGEMGGGQNMIIILNPNGTLNEELMLAHGVNQDTIKAVSEAHGLGSGDPTAPIKSLQHPIPQKELGNVKPLMTTSSIPRSVMETVMTEVRSQESTRSVILDPKDNFLVLDDLDREHLMDNLDLPVSQTNTTHKIINIGGTNHIITSSRPLPRITSQFLPGVQKQEIPISVSGLINNTLTTQLPITPLGTLDLSLPKKPDPSVLAEFVNPGALVPETTVLKALTKPESGNIVTKDHLTGKIIRTTGQKIRRPKVRDENGNGTPYVQRKTTSLGALGQALHGPLMGIPRDSRENAVQICPICKFQATTKNPYRHLQDHLARNHFKDRIAADLPTKKPYICPMPGCDNKHYPDWQAVMRHYIGKKHGILDKFVKEELAQIRKENGGKIPGAVITPTIECQL